MSPFLIWIVALYIERSSASLLFAFHTADNVFISSTSAYSSGGVARRDNIDWIRPIGSHTLVGFHGDNVDCEIIYDELLALNRNHEMDFNGRSHSSSDIANICRSIIARHLRESPLEVDIIVAGWHCHSNRPKVYWLDRIGSLKEVPYAAHGQDQTLILSLLDQQRSMGLGRKKMPVVGIGKLQNSIDVKGNVQEVQSLKNVALGGGEDGAIRNYFHSHTVSSENRVVDNTTPPPTDECNNLKELALVRKCWGNIQKRSISKIGKFRIKSIGSLGTVDYGLFT